MGTMGNEDIMPTTRDLGFIYFEGSFSLAGGDLKKFVVLARCWGWTL
jgi:hypothetical protein